MLYPLFPALFNNGTVDCTLGYLHAGGHRLVCAPGEFVPALAALPDAGPFARHRFHVALRAAVQRMRDLLDIVHALAHESSVPAAESS